MGRDDISYLESILTYKEHSLSIQSIDNDDYIVFDLVNPPVPLGGKVTDLDIYLNQNKIDKENIFIEKEGRIIKASSISEKSPVAFYQGEGSRIYIKDLSSALFSDRNEVEISTLLKGFGVLRSSLKFADYFSSYDLDKNPLRKKESIKNPVKPLLISNGSSYLILSETGDIAATWNWMGVVSNVGGLYTPPAWTISGLTAYILENGYKESLARYLDGRDVQGNTAEFHYSRGELTVRRKTLLPRGENNFYEKYEINGINGKKIRFELDASASLTGYGLTGVIPDDIVAEINKNEIILKSEKSGFSARLISSLVPADVEIVGRSVKLIYEIEARDGFSIEIGAGENPSIHSDFDKLYSSERESFQKTVSKRARVVTPDKEMNTAYDLLLQDSEYIKFYHPEIGKGVVAGFTRFPNYWGRDSAWTLFGVLDSGDFEFVRDAIQNILEYQADHDDESINMIEGEIPTVISGEKFMHVTSYGSGDTTLLYPILIMEYIKRSGDTDFLKKNYDKIVKLVEWGYRKDRDNDLLIEHGESSTGSHFKLVDNTWMDHIDRRESGNDVQALWATALRCGAELAELVGDYNNSKKWKSDSEKVVKKINALYWNGSYFGDTITPEGDLDNKLRPNQAVILLYGLTDKHKAYKVLERLEKPDMTAEHGMRTLSTGDADYSPDHYHNGAVWPLVTGWSAMAEFRYNRGNKGVDYLKKTAKLVVRDNGMIAETYKGDISEPYNACLLQGWSVGTYLNASITYMFGIDADAINHKIALNPVLPEHWEHAEILNYRVGDNYFNIYVDNVSKIIKIETTGKDSYDFISGGYDIVLTENQSDRQV